MYNPIGTISPKLDNKMDELVRDVLEVLQLNESERFKRLYRAVHPGAFPSRGEDEEKQGRSIFQSSVSLLRKKICGDARIRQLAQSAGDPDKLILIRSILKIVGVFFTGAAVTLITAEVISQGLIKFCEAVWKGDSHEAE